MAEPEVEKKAVDARVAWLRTRLTTSMRCKEVTLDRLFSNEDYAAAIASFIDTSDCNRLLVYDAGKGELAAVRGATARCLGTPSGRAVCALQRARLATCAAAPYPNYAAAAPALPLPRSRRMPDAAPTPCSPRCPWAS